MNVDAQYDADMAAEWKYVNACERVDSAETRFLEWLSDFANDSVIPSAVWDEARWILIERILNDETPSYELSGVYSESGRWVHFHL